MSTNSLLGLERWCWRKEEVAATRGWWRRSAHEDERVVASIWIGETAAARAGADPARRWRGSGRPAVAVAGDREAW